jgi:hypothetical protein
MKIQELEKKVQEKSARTGKDANGKIKVRDSNTEGSSANINDYYENPSISDHKSGRNQK